VLSGVMQAIRIVSMFYLVGFPKSAAAGKKR